MEPKIVEINSEETLNIRQKVMWPDKSIDYVRIPNDDKGRHFGVFVDSKLVSVISLFIVNKEAQFRKFATLTEYQSKGYGTILLSEIIKIVKDNTLNKLWCNARIDKAGYYKKFGMTLTNHKFIKGGIEYVIMEKVFHYEQL